MWSEMREHRADCHFIGKKRQRIRVYDERDRKPRKRKRAQPAASAPAAPISPEMETQTSASPVSAHELQQAVSLIAPAPLPQQQQQQPVTFQQVIVHEGYHTVPVVTHPHVVRPGWGVDHPGMQRH